MASSIATTAFQSFNKLRKKCSTNFKGSSLLNYGMGDNLETGNLWIAPGFTVFFYAILWTTKLSNIAQEQTQCRGANLYKFEGTALHEDVEKYCYYGIRYYVDHDEPIQYNQEWKDMRIVKNPEWILWFWAPILLVMQGVTRFFWKLLMKDQDIDFDTVKKACQKILTEEEAGTQKLNPDSIEKINTCFNNVKFSSDIFSRFLCFKIILIFSPLFLWLFVLPLLIGKGFRTWGFDIAKACWEDKYWQGVPLKPFFDSKSVALILPLIPRITFCDYPVISLGDVHIHTYRCYLDTTWHERTALITWFMLAFLTTLNFLNLLYWVYWAGMMSFKDESIQQYMMEQWYGINTKEESDFSKDDDFESIENFSNEFSMAKSLFLYFVEVQTNHFIACKIAKELFHLSKNSSMRNGELKPLMSSISNSSKNSNSATSNFSNTETIGI